MSPFPPDLATGMSAFDPKRTFVFWLAWTSSHQHRSSVQIHSVECSSEPVHDKANLPTGSMNELEVSNQDLSRLADEALDLAKSYWQSLEVRRAYPSTSGKQTTELFSREWSEHGRGQEVLKDFKIIAEHGRPSTGRFFGYIFGSGEPIGALGELLAAALNQNVTAWRSAHATIQSAQALDVAAISWAPGLSRGHDSRPSSCPTAGRDYSVAARTGIAGAGLAQRGLFPSPHKG